MRTTPHAPHLRTDTMCLWALDAIPPDRHRIGQRRLPRLPPFQLPTRLKSALPCPPWPSPWAPPSPNTTSVWCASPRPWIRVCARVATLRCAATVLQLPVILRVDVLFVVSLFPRSILFPRHSPQYRSPFLSPRQPKSTPEG